MTAVYPGTVATILATKADATAAPTDHPAHHNQLAEELVAVQTELGTNPSLAASTVATLTSALMGRWVPLMHSQVNLSAAATGTYVGITGNTTNVLTTSASPALYAMQSERLDPADYAITGFTVKYRVVATFNQNGVNNAGTSVATAGLYSVVPAGTTTTWLPTFGAVVTGTTAAKTGGTAADDTEVISSTITAPAADTYTLAVAVTTATTAGSTKIGLRLEYSYA